MKDSAVSKAGELGAAVDEEPSSVRRSRTAEEFALLMTVCARVAQAPPLTFTPAAEEGGARVEARPADFWRRDDGGVTAPAGTGGAPAAAPTRFVTQIVHKELGPMAVAVERNGDAVRVVFEVSDAVARVALETERASLLDALHGAGVRVASVVVVVRAGGIPLAQGGKRPKGRSEEDNKNLDLVG